MEVLINQSSIISHTLKSLHFFRRKKNVAVTSHRLKANTLLKTLLKTKKVQEF